MPELLLKADNTRIDTQHDVEIEMDIVNGQIEKLREEIQARAKDATLLPCDREAFQLRLASLYARFLALQSLKRSLLNI